MKISSITRGASAALILTVVLITLALIWALHQLEEAFNHTLSYNEYRNRIHTEIKQPVTSYLHSGDATLLTRLNENLGALVEDDPHDAWMPESIRHQVREQLSQMRQSMLSELREAGKLSSPEALLIINEREQSDALISLAEYVKDAADAPSTARMDYLQTIVGAQRSLQQLTLTRESHFETLAPQVKETLLLYLEELAGSIERFRALPELGVFEQEAVEQDEMAALMGWAPPTNNAAEDRAEGLIATLHFLQERYPKELGNAQKFAALKQSRRENTLQQLDRLESTLVQMESIINDRHRKIQVLVYWVLGISMGLIILTGTIIALLQHNLARFLVISSRHLERLSNGDLKTRFELHSRFVEVRNLGDAMDRLQTYFLQLIARIHEETARLDQLQRETAASAQTLERVVSTQQSQTEASATRMSQLNSSFQEVADTAAHASHATHDAQLLVDQGSQALGETRQQIILVNTEAERTAAALEALREDALAIAKVLAVIEGFAEQTNLLALNAAIEAAVRAMPDVVLPWWPMRCATWPATPLAPPRRFAASSASWTRPRAPLPSGWIPNAMR